MPRKGDRVTVDLGECEVMRAAAFPGCSAEIRDAAGRFIVLPADACRVVERKVVTDLREAWAANHIIPLEEAAARFIRGDRGHSDDPLAAACLAIIDALKEAGA